VRFDVCVIGGCGHGGLPLSIALAARGQRVAVVDIDAEAIDKVRSGAMPFMDQGGQEMLRRVLAMETLTVGERPDVVADSADLVLVVNTPVDHRFGPALRDIDQILETYRPYFRDGQLLVLRSTFFPGTAERVQRWAQEAGIALHVAVCPERIAQGFALQELPTLPQLVGACTLEGQARARALFELLTDDIVVLEPVEAELAKLFTNAWRYIKFAAANQFFMIADECGADFDRIYHGITYKYRRAEDLPRPGFTAGPCLFKDTMQLSAFTNNNFFLGHAAMLVNEGLPHYLVSQLKHRYDLRASTVGILGMAFKADIDDARDSLSYTLRNLLEFAARKVLCSDPYLAGPEITSLERVLDEADIVIIATPHRCYRSLDLGDRPVIDIWNVLGKGTRL
jgi:UDP-N-acetyl-D-mannosaminuronic acid dehydrogenase